MMADIWEELLGVEGLGCLMLEQLADGRFIALLFQPRTYLQRFNRIPAEMDPQPELNDSLGDDISLRNETEEMMADIWEELLGVQAAEAPSRPASHSPSKAVHQALSSGRESYIPAGDHTC
jgi:hypothetical protein